LRGMANPQQALSPVLLASSDVEALLRNFSEQYRSHEARVESILAAHAWEMRAQLSCDAACGAPGPTAVSESRKASLARISHAPSSNSLAVGSSGARCESRGRGDGAGGAQDAHMTEGRGPTTAARQPPRARASPRAIASAASLSSVAALREEVSESSDVSGSDEIPDMMQVASVDGGAGAFQPPLPATVPHVVAHVDDLGAPPVVAWLDRDREPGSASAPRSVPSASRLEPVRRPPGWADVWSTTETDHGDDTGSDVGQTESKSEERHRACQLPKKGKSRKNRAASRGWSGRSTARATWRGSFSGGRSRLSRFGEQDWSLIRQMRLGLRKVVCNRRFEYAAAVMIFANASSIGWEADWSIHNLGQEMPWYLQGLEYVFAVAFTIELMLRIGAEGKGFAHRENANLVWNLFDVFVVLTSWSEKIVGYVTSGGNVSVLKLLQIFRLVRILRIIRVMRFFKELRLMVQGIAASLKPLVWCIVLLCLVMFTFGVFIVQAVSQHLVEVGPSGANRQEFLRYFGGLGVTIYTLYASIIGGIDWDTVAQFLFEVNPMMIVMFSAYVAFAVLCMLNIVTGVFVEHANAITKADADNMVMEELAFQEKRLAEMRAIFERMVEGETNEDKLSLAQFQRFAQNEKVQAYFRRIGLSVDNENANALFTLIDLDNDGLINLEEFLGGCMQFIGAARQLDIARLRKDNAEIREIVRVAIEKGPHACDASAVKSPSMALASSAMAVLGSPSMRGSAADRR